LECVEDLAEFAYRSNAGKQKCACGAALDPDGVASTDTRARITVGCDDFVVGDLDPHLAATVSALQPQPVGVELQSPGYRLAAPSLPQNRVARHVATLSDEARHGASGETPPTPARNCGASGIEDHAQPRRVVDIVPVEEEDSPYVGLIKVEAV
jgi:hypothetical protein